MSRIKATHVGSLPRGDELTALLRACDAGEPCDARKFDAKVSAARAGIEAYLETKTVILQLWRAIWKRAPTITDRALA